MIHDIYLLTAVCYFKNSHFTARFCTVTNTKIDDKWYFYDGMKNGGKISTQTNGSLRFKFVDEGSSAQIIFYKRCNN